MFQIPWAFESGMLEAGVLGFGRRRQSREMGIRRQDRNVAPKRGVKIGVLLFRL
jgi:hypothetical protein